MAVSTHCRRESVTDRVEPPTPTYVVECYWPDISKHQAEAALAGIARSQERVSPTNRVWPLCCILVPSDGMALFLIAGPSADLIRDVGERIQLPFDRIVESISIAAVTTPALSVQHLNEGK
jgi:hypothetical protein